MAYPILAPNSTWYKSSQSRSTITEINIVDSYSGTADETWNADVDNSGSIKCYRTGTVLIIAGNGSGKIAMNADSSRIFSNLDSPFFSSLTTLSGLALLDASNVTTLNRAFDRCSAVTSLDVCDWNVSNVTNMERTFQGCIALTSLDLSTWNVSKVETCKGMFLTTSELGDMALTSIGDISRWNPKITGDGVVSMFQHCTHLRSVDMSQFDMSNAESFKWMFVNCQALTTTGDISKWNTSNVIDMSQMFSGCRSLTEIDVSGWDVSKVTTFEYMFYSLNTDAWMQLRNIRGLQNWNTSSAINMHCMFAFCGYMQTFDVFDWDVSHVTNFKSMFESCNALEVLDVSKWDTSSAIDMGWMFWGCRSLKELDVSNWNMSNIDSLHHFAAHCEKITIIGVENWDVSKCRTFNATFHSNKNTYYDLSNWDTTNCLSFGQMFELNTELVEIKGLENWNTSKVESFSEMFNGCSALRELDLSSFDTRQVAEEHYDEWRDETYTGSMLNMFSGTTKLQKIILGENFSFNGDGTCQPAMFTTPSAELIEGADGHWYAVDGTAYTASEIPNRTAATYYVYIPALTTTDVSAFAINKVEDQEVYETMKSQGKVNEDEIYIIDENVNAVLHSEQYLSEEKKRQARANIDALAKEDLKNASETESGLMSPIDKMRLNALRNAEMLENKTDEITVNATDEQYPTAAAVKHYVDNQISDNIENHIEYIPSQTLRVGNNVLTDDIVTLGTGWSGSLAEGFTHTSGNTEPLTFAVGAADGEAYLVDGTDSGYNQAAIALSLGDSPTSEPYNGTPTIQWGLICVGDNGALKIIPTSGYTGKITGLMCRKISDDGENEVEITLGDIQHMDNSNHLTGFWNIAMGGNALGNSVNGTRNIAIGKSSLAALKSGGRNIGLGTYTLSQMEKGENNIAIGADAGLELDESSTNVMIGKSAMYYGKNTECVAIGLNALKGGAATAANGVLAIGTGAGYSGGGTSNVFVGKEAGYRNTGNLNTFVGQQAGVNATSWGCVAIGAQADTQGYSQSIAIGRQAKATKSTQAVLGSDAITETLLKGNLVVRGTDGKMRQIVFDENGLATWLEDGTAVDINYLNKSGWTAGSYLGTNDEGTVTEKTSVDIGNEIVNLYVWEKYNAQPGTAVLEDKKTITLASHTTIYNTTTKIVYADSYSVVDGEIILNNPSDEIYISSSQANANTANNTFKRKYIKVVSTTKSTALGTTTIGTPNFYYVGADAEAVYETLSESVTINSNITMSNVQPIRIASPISYLTSVTDNAYPTNAADENGYWYVRGNKLGALAMLTSAEEAIL